MKNKFVSTVVLLKHSHALTHLCVCLADFEVTVKKVNNNKNNMAWEAEDSQPTPMCTLIYRHSICWGHHRAQRTNTVILLSDKIHSPS